MQKKSLRQTANHYIQNNRAGCLRDKKQRHYVIHKVIDDLFILGHAPQSWEALTNQDFHKLVRYWQRKKVKPATMMKHMTIIRKFLMSLGHEVTSLENKQLGITKKISPPRKIKITQEIVHKKNNAIARVLLGLQIHFGLTLSEAMRMVPSIHIQEHQLWLTREITFNHEDRCVPFQTTEQTKILDELNQLTASNQSLIETHGYDAVLFAWRDALRALKLPPRKAYRYAYAQFRQKQLLTHLTHSPLPHK